MCVASWTQRVGEVTQICPGLLPFAWTQSQLLSPLCSLLFPLIFSLLCLFGRAERELELLFSATMILGDLHCHQNKAATCGSWRDLIFKERFASSLSRLSQRQPVSALLGA